MDDLLFLAFTNFTAIRVHKRSLDLIDTPPAHLIFQGDFMCDFRFGGFGFGVDAPNSDLVDVSILMRT